MAGCLAAPAGSVLVEGDADLEASPHVQSAQAAVARAEGAYPVLFEDPQFVPGAAAIEGAGAGKAEKCRCGNEPSLSRVQRGENAGKEYFHCRVRRCKYFRWAYQAQRLQWHRFGRHNRHVLVGPEGFKAEDLVQGKVGDCWFLSALAVIAERPDLIMRLFPRLQVHAAGVVEVRLFLDGMWRTVVVDNYLPCIIDRTASPPPPHGTRPPAQLPHDPRYPFALPPGNAAAIEEHNAMLAARLGGGAPSLAPPVPDRPVTAADLAYAKAHDFQVWGPILEKAYAKAHGCYTAISGGEVAEAFLDLTGAPTLSVNLQSFASSDAGEEGGGGRGSTAGFRVGGAFRPQGFWTQLKSYHAERLPMGCGTAGGRQLQEVGLVGHHAYSILDVKEWLLPPSFPRRGRGVGNMSGFGDDGVARLLKIRNPHGRGEWTGDWSDASALWEQALGESLGTGAQDGCFWMSYDDFLMAFAVVDICLAFPGLHARSFCTAFPAKLDPVRTTKLFEVALPAGDAPAEVFLMAIQGTKRGASSGRSDRKKSYKPCDVGFLVLDAAEEGGDDYKRVGGALLGFTKSGHHRVVLSGRRRRILAVPVSFGHPAAPEKDLPFVVRVVASRPVRVAEAPPRRVRLHAAMQSFCINTLGSHVLLDGALPSGRRYRVLLCEKMGATAFVQLMVAAGAEAEAVPPFTVTARVRGMLFRTATGFVPHETLAKGQKFEAAWRGYTAGFQGETASRLLAVLVRSGQDWELGGVGASPAPAAQPGPPSGPEPAGVFARLRRNVVPDAAWLAAGGAAPCDPSVQEQLDLERALALSRGVVVPGAACLEDYGCAAEAALVKFALTSSMAAEEEAGVEACLRRSLEDEDDARLQEALRASAQAVDDGLAAALQASLCRSTDPAAAEAGADVDADAEEMAKAIALSLEVTGGGGGGGRAEGRKRPAEYDRAASAAKRRNPPGGPPPDAEVIELLDSDSGSSGSAWLR